MSQAARSLGAGARADRLKGVTCVLAAAALWGASETLTKLLMLSGLSLKAHEGSVLALTEIPFSILIGMITLGEYPSLLSWTGVSLILLAGGLASVKQRG